MPRPINNMHRIPISGIENKKCGTVTGVGVNTLSYYRISSKPPLTNYTYESLQRALYPNMTVAEINKQLAADMKDMDWYVEWRNVS